MLDPKALLVLLTAATPVIELRGAIPLGLATGLPIYEVYLLAMIGNMLPVPFVLFGTKYLLSKLMAIPRLHNWIMDWGGRKGTALSQKIDKWGWLGLLVFVSIPLPGTGAWTGSFAAAFLGLKFWSSLVSICLGVIIAGLLVSGLGVAILNMFF